MKVNSGSGDWIADASLLQIFVGRDPKASLVTHRASVLKQLQTFDWKQLFSESGFTGVYLLGLFDNRGPIVVTEEEGTILALDGKDRLPSVFALRDHGSVNPLIGSNQELADLVATIHKANGKVLVDFVPNHTALSHPWLTAHPEFYHADPNSKSGFVEEFSGDVVKLNYENQLLRAAQIKVIEGLAGTGCDGIRCDMAHLVPNHFWIEALDTTRRSFPGFVAIAESYGTNVFDWSPFEHLLQAGFDAVYHDYLFRKAL
jgi:glycosidase